MSVLHGLVVLAADAGSIAWIRDLREAMRPVASGAAYQNYIDGTRADWKPAYYGANLQRLVAIKRKYDRGNLLHFKQSIPTRL